MRDLVDAPLSDVERERGKIAHEGWGARLLALQGDDGAWPSEYHPDTYRGRPTSRNYLIKPDGASTFYALLLLRDFGLPPDDAGAGKACQLLLDQGMRADGGFSLLNDDGTTPSETCVTGMALSILSHFECDDARLDTWAQHLLDEQMSDGGWNCQRVYGATHSSMHTTILAVEGLRHYELHRQGLRTTFAGRRLAGVSSCSRTGCFARIGQARSSTRRPNTRMSNGLRSRSSHSRRSGTTTSCGRSITSRP